MVNFLNPLWFWALLALLVPLLIHLINRGKPKAVPFGSLLWLPEKNTKLSRQLKFQDGWLWLLRSLLFVLVAGLIAHPFVNQTFQQKNKHWLLIKDGVQNKIINQIEDTISFEQWTVKRLSYGLEAFDFKEKNPSFSYPIHPYEVLQLVEAENQKPLSVTVVGNFNAADLNGKIPNYSFPVDWVLLPLDYSKEHVAQIQREGSSSYLVTKETLHLTKIEEEQRATKIDSNDLTINLQDQTSLIVYDENFKDLQKATLAALKALQQYHKLSFNIKVAKEDDLPTDFEKIDLLFWLSESALSHPNPRTKIFQISKNLPSGTFIHNKPNIIEWSEPTHYNKLPYLFNEMIFYNEAIIKRLTQTDSRPIHSSFYAHEKVEDTIPLQYQNNKQQPLVFYAWVLLVVLLVLERYINSR